jgi:hypothetical protein
VKAEEKKGTKKERGRKRGQAFVGRSCSANAIGNDETRINGIKDDTGRDFIYGFAVNSKGRINEEDVAG